MSQELAQTTYGRVALVTGAANPQGIGAATARALAAVGVHVALTDRAFPAHGPSAEERCDELAALGGAGHSFVFDLSDAAMPARLLDAVEAALGPVEILVNNAAVSLRDGLDDFSAEALDAHYAVNVRGATLLSVEFARRIAARGSAGRGGRIINLTSGQGTGPMPDELAYATTKGAIEAFTLSFSAVAAPLGITVNAVDPGPTDTGWIWPELRTELEANAPMGRVGLPEDAARMIRFLASSDAAWVTGQVIRARGGL